MRKPTLIGVDTGGTFTDFVYIRKNAIHTLKVLSTPGNPGDAVMEGIKQITGEENFNYSVIHGTTVATNALLERKGVPTALLTTKGFGDLLEIARQNRPMIYDLELDPPKPLIPASHRFEIPERVLHTGEVKEEIDLDELEKVLSYLRSKNIESLAICFLHSYANDKHEKVAAELARKRSFFVSPSSEILPEYREYERMSTTVVNAYVAPTMDRYIESLQERLGKAGLRVMKSNGGIITALTARKESVHTILSGPAGGVVGAFEIAKRSGYENVITFDMGGTSTDVALCPGQIVTTSESMIAGSPIRVPVIDIYTVGAGGGSIAKPDSGGALTVGPESAGADPGPACYGEGDLLTVTDANLVLGRLDAGHFLGGKMHVDKDRTASLVVKHAKNWGIDQAELAGGIIRIVNSEMEKALRVISVAKGYDPSEFTLVSFGGAGSLHAADLAIMLSIGTVLIPVNPGIYSAMGMLFSDFIKDYSQTILHSDIESMFKTLEKTYGPLGERAVKEMKAEGIEESKISLVNTIDMRYKGQSFELNVPFTESFVEDFHSAHLQRYGYAEKGRKVEAVTARVRSIGTTEHPQIIKKSLGKASKSAKIGKRSVYNGTKMIETDIYDRTGFSSGFTFRGPAVVHEYSTTSYIPENFEVRIDEFDNMILHSQKR